MATHLQHKPTQMPGFFGLSEEFLSRNTYLSECLRKIRRGYFAVFHADYVKANIQERQGECHRCGACCKLVYDCPFLGHDAHSLPYCRIYGDLRPGACKNYPFDRVDAEIEQCGFKFKQ
ncbi:MAG: hypothetical protein HY075_14600 [Deltaproteobacteria bacterium]|nr:hypothetical protein [Deltaproteobacteria bacterium]